MTTALRSALAAIAALLAVAPAMASFQAADLIYIPAVAQTTGSGTSHWKTDLYITNVDEVAIDVAMIYLPSGLASNATYFIDRTYWLGGREEDGFGFVNEVLADIPSQGTVVLRDIVGEYWVDQAGLNGMGAMVVFAYEADTLEDDGTRVYRNAIANARIYNDTTRWDRDPDGHGFIEEPVSYGQQMPGVAWYNLADPAALGDDFDFTYMILVGGEETPRFRYNLGVLNASDPQTQITVAMQAFQANGEPYVDDEGDELISIQTIPIGAHVQWYRIFSTLWDLEEIEMAMIKVSFVGWVSTSPEPVPAFITYGSLIDESSDDPTTILGAFADPYDIDCMWSGDGAAAAKATGRIGRRPLEVAPR
ncbi:MAG TPA: hypothetical protein PKJ99_13210 [Thermoanaerobaculales bacterium]|nr:hypothetical protein [Thermoanaerobaculales bacterium]